LSQRRHCRTASSRSAQIPPGPSPTGSPLPCGRLLGTPTDRRRQTLPIGSVFISHRASVYEILYTPRGPEAAASRGRHMQGKIGTAGTELKT
jgi:hypothetical protein